MIFENHSGLFHVFNDSSVRKAQMHFNILLLIVLSLEMKYCSLICSLLKKIIKHVSTRMLSIASGKTPNSK